MKYAIIGSGKIGTAIARAFARKNIDVGIANTRRRENLEPLAEKLGPSVFPQSTEEASEADMVILAVPFRAHKEVAKVRKNWGGKIVVDVTNALNLTPEERGPLRGIPSSAVVAKAFGGARLVKAFNHLPANQLGTWAQKTSDR